jgi:hypothetical protein
MKGVTRPEMTTLPESAQIPPGNLRRPPTRFTHRLVADQPYFYEPDASGQPAGTFDAGTRVARIAEEGTQCRVVDSRGLSVYTGCAGLEPLSKSRSVTRKR